MRFVRLLAIILGFSAYFLTALSNRAYATYTISNCNATFSTGSISEVSLNTYEPASVEVAYPVICSGTTVESCSQGSDRTTIPYRLQNDFENLLNQPVSPRDASNVRFISVSGQFFLVGSIPLNNNDYIENAESIYTNVWSNTLKCSSGSRIAITRITEGCSLTPAPVRNQNGSYDIPVTIGRDGNGNFLTPGQGYYLQIGSIITNVFELQPEQAGSGFGFYGVNLNAGDYQIFLRRALGQNICSISVSLDEFVEVGNPEFPDPIIDPIPTPDVTQFALCKQLVPGTEPFEQCTTCLDQSPPGIWTAVGCIQGDAKTIVSTVMQIGLGIAGGVGIIMIMAAGFLFSTSQGDPKRLSEAKELMSSAIIGLLFIIFSVTILQFIGVSILRIPGFGG